MSDFRLPSSSLSHSTLGISLFVAILLHPRGLGVWHSTSCHLALSHKEVGTTIEYSSVSSFLPQKLWTQITTVSLLHLLSETWDTGFTTILLRLLLEDLGCSACKEFLGTGNECTLPIADKHQRLALAVVGLLAVACHFPHFLKV